MGEGIAGRVAVVREPVIIGDVKKSPLFQNRKINVSIGSLLCLPMVYNRTELVGVLNLSHSKPRAFNRKDLKLVNILLAPAALALRNARAMREMEDINGILKTDLSMTDKAVDEFGKHIFRIFTCMSVGVLTAGYDGMITSINKRASQLLGLDTGASLKGIIPDEVFEELGSGINEIAVDVEHGGRVLNMEMSTIPMRPSWQFLICLRDATVDRFKERELVRIKDQYKDMVENALDAMYIIRRGRFLLTNRKFQEMLGYSQDEITGRHFRHIITREGVASLAEALRVQTGNVFIPNLEIRAVRKDGGNLFLEISIGRLVIDNEDCYIGVVRDIPSKKELLALKTRFLHVASHEIRVPLTVIRGYSRMLSRNCDSALSDSQKENIGEIEAQCEKLLHFSNSLLDFAKINTEKITLHRQAVNCEDYISGIVRNMQIGARDHKVNIVYSVAKGVPELFVDPIKFEQALCNLLHNAIKHSPEPGEVSVSITKGIHDQNAMSRLLKRESVMISVTDHGPGIKGEEARDLFNDFYVGASGRARGGIGLGLSITKEIIHAHGGSVEARPSDSGGHFVITIPLNTDDE
jgi:PAS domain S-box-containing protein